MEPTSPYRPRVSRETRLLLTAGVVAIAALWLLARIRFQERPVTPNPVPALLSQLANRPTYEDLAAEIAQLQARVEPSLLVLDVPPAVPGSPSASHRLGALRLRDDLAVTLLPPARIPELWNDPRILARDPASGLVVVRIPSQVTASPLVHWTPRRLEQPRYLIASDVSSPRVSLRPVFVGSLDPMESPYWSEAIWSVPGRSDLVPGSFVFTNGAAVIFPAIYAYALYHRVPGSPAITGTAWGVALRLVAQTVVMPMMGAGLFSSAMGGMMAAMGSLIGQSTRSG